MSDLSDVILPTGLVVIGLYAVKRMLDANPVDKWDPENKMCLGPICWSTYRGGRVTQPRVVTQPSPPAGLPPGGSGDSSWWEDWMYGAVDYLRMMKENPVW